MERPELGPLVFGTLPMGPLQAGYSPEKGGGLILRGLNAGITTVDTAALYGTYPHIRWALERFSGAPNIITKTHAPTAGEARAHVEEALRALGVGRLAVVNVHGARLEDPFAERAEVFAEILKMIDEGKVGHLGLSTHRWKVAEKSAAYPEIEFLHPLINRTGMGIIDGGAGEMAAAIGKAAASGKTVYAMKALAGGNLIADARDSIEYVRRLPGVASLAIGMLTGEEVDANVALFLERREDAATWKRLAGRERRLVIMDKFCAGCGACVEACSSLALRLEGGVARVESDKCVLCGYCAPACPAFLIRIV